jgi:hypothetical protein
MLCVALPLRSKSASYREAFCRQQSRRSLPESKDSADPCDCLMTAMKSSCLYPVCRLIHIELTHIIAIVGSAASGFRYRNVLLKNLFACRGAILRHFAEGEKEQSRFSFFGMVCPLRSTRAFGPRQRHTPRARSDQDISEPHPSCAGGFAMWAPSRSSFPYGVSCLLTIPRATSLHGSSTWASCVSLSHMAQEPGF